MKSSMKKSALMMMAMAMLEVAEGSYHRRYPTKPLPPKKDESEQAKLKRHREYSSDQAAHEYIINGVKIIATSKKVARKIYNRMKGGKKK